MSCTKRITSLSDSPLCPSRQTWSYTTFRELFRFEYEDTFIYYKDHFVMFRCLLNAICVLGEYVSEKDVLENSSQVDEQNHKIEKNKRCVPPLPSHSSFPLSSQIKGTQNLKSSKSSWFTLSAGIWSSNRLSAFRLSRKRYNRHVDLLCWFIGSVY